MTWERVNNWQKKPKEFACFKFIFFLLRISGQMDDVIGLYLRHFRRLNLSRTSSSLSGKTLFLRLSRFQVATSLQLLVKWFKVLTLFSNAKTLSLKSSTVWVILNMATVNQAHRYQNEYQDQCHRLGLGLRLPGSTDVPSTAEVWRGTCASWAFSPPLPPPPAFAWVWSLWRASLGPPYWRCRNTSWVLTTFLTRSGPWTGKAWRTRCPLGRWTRSCGGRCVASCVFASEGRSYRSTWHRNFEPTSLRCNTGPVTPASLSATAPLSGWTSRRRSFERIDKTLSAVPASSPRPTSICSPCNCSLHRTVSSSRSRKTNRFQNTDWKKRVTLVAVQRKEKAFFKVSKSSFWEKNLLCI